MATLTGVGDNVIHVGNAPGELIDVAISGTYNMEIDLQFEDGSPHSGAWKTVKTYREANATVADRIQITFPGQRVRLVVQVDTSGSATATLTDNDDRVVKIFRDQDGNELLTLRQSGLEISGNLTVQDKIPQLAVADVATATPAAAPAGGTGAAEGGWDTAANRDAAITTINSMRTLADETKTQLNDLLTKLRTAGIIDA